MTNEPVYCFNCDNDAVVYVDWEYPNEPSTYHRTFMCRTCADVFQFGQVTSEPIQDIGNLND